MIQKVLDGQASKSIAARIASMLTLVVAVSGCYWWCPQPSDSSMIRTFDDHRSEFERLLELARPEQRNLLLRSDGTGARPEADDEYLELLQRIGATAVAVSPEMNCFLGVSCGSCGLPCASNKGWQYCQEPPLPVIDSLDDASKFQADPSYRRIEGNWYLIWWN